MDVIGGVIARLDYRAPRWADRMRWWRIADGSNVRAITTLVRRGDTVLDIGAAQGHFASRMLDLVGDEGRVHAFEPNPFHHDRLRLLARSRSFELHPVALSDHSGTATLHVPIVRGHLSAGLASLEERPESDAESVTVDVMRLDDVIDSHQRVSFVKCDVEGHEDAVLRGATGMIERDRPAFLIEIEQRHRAEDVSRALEFFAGFGYEGWALYPGGIRPVEQFDIQRDQVEVLRAATSPEQVPSGYVNDFLFVKPGVDVSALVDPTLSRN